MMPSWQRCENKDGTGAGRCKSHLTTRRRAISIRKLPATSSERPSTSSIRPNRPWRAHCSWRFAPDLSPVLGRRPRLRAVDGAPDARSALQFHTLPQLRAIGVSFVEPSSGPPQPSSHVGEGRVGARGMPVSTKGEPDASPNLLRNHGADGRAGAVDCGRLCA